MLDPESARQCGVALSSPMKTPLRWPAALCGLALSLCSTFGAGAALERLTPVPDGEQIPIEDFFRPSLFTRAQLSPSGTHIAALISTGDDQRVLLVYEIATQQFGRLNGGRERDISHFGWLDDQTIFFHLTTRKLYHVGLFAANIKRLHMPRPLLQYNGASLIAVPHKHRLRPLVWQRFDAVGDDGRDGGVVLVNASGDYGKMFDLTMVGARYTDIAEVREQNERRIVQQFPKPAAMGAGYLADKTGELAFAFTAADGLFNLHRLEMGAWIPSPIDLETTDIWGSGNRPGEVVASVASKDGSPAELRFMDVATGEARELLLHDKKYDFRGGLYRDADTGNILGLQFSREIPVTEWLDPGFLAVQKMAEAQFPRQVVRILGNAQKGKIFLIQTWSDRHPSAYHILDLEKRQMGLVKNSRPWINPDRMRPMSMIKYRTAEGRELDAYLTLPAGASKATPAPLVVLPHGGPWVRDTWGFDDEVQFLASRGYAVLQPNYRGSPGYDWMFPVEDQWDFLKMHADVTAATRQAIKTGLVDPKRVAIMGGSFGAYLALCGVVHEPDLYRCAVTIAGVFDWAEVVKEEKYYQFESPQYARMLRKLGDPKKEKDKFDAISPIRRVEHVRVPMFVSHGKDDAVAAVGESKRLIAALRKNNVPVESLLVGEEGHGMARFSNRVELYRRIEAFLAKNLPVGPAVL